MRPQREGSSDRYWGFFPLPDLGPLGRGLFPPPYATFAAVPTGALLGSGIQELCRLGAVFLSSEVQGQRQVGAWRPPPKFHLAQAPRQTLRHNAKLDLPSTPAHSRTCLEGEGSCHITRHPLIQGNAGHWPPQAGRPHPKCRPIGAIIDALCSGRNRDTGGRGPSERHLQIKRLISKIRLLVPSVGDRHRAYPRWKGGFSPRGHKPPTHPPPWWNSLIWRLVPRPGCTTATGQGRRGLDENLPHVLP